jgi:uncharacterized OsmC-like protein
MGIDGTKRWSVKALSSGQEPLAIYCDERPLTQTALATLDNVSPVEYLLIAVASCFALSCRAVLATRKLPALAFEVAVTGAKAADAPSRLQRIGLTAIFHGGVNDAQAASIAAAAKLLCTVTNTIFAAPTIAVTGLSVAQAAENAVPTDVVDSPPHR